MPQPADELRTAAQQLRKRATAATPGPWQRPLNTRYKCTVTGALPEGERGQWIDGIDPATEQRERATVATIPTWSNGRHSRQRGGRDLEYIASMHPGVGVAVADWLDAAAVGYDATVKGAAGVWSDPADAAERDTWVAKQTDQYALAVARQVLGTTETPTAHRCDNCDGVDPDTCLANPDRAPAAPPVADQADLRNRIAQALAADDGHPWDTLSETTQEHYHDSADAVLAVHPEPTDQAAEVAELRAELDKLIRWHKEDGTQAAKMRKVIERLRVERTELIRQRDQIAMDTIKALPAPTDRAAMLTETERTMLTYALDQAQDRIWSDDGFTDEDQAAVTSLRRLADEAQHPDPVGLCGACGVPRESHHHDYERTPGFDEEQQPTPAPTEEPK